MCMKIDTLYKWDIGNNTKIEKYLRLFFNSLFVLMKIFILLEISNKMDMQENNDNIVLNKRKYIYILSIKLYIYIYYTSYKNVILIYKILHI